MKVNTLIKTIFLTLFLSGGVCWAQYSGNIRNNISWTLQDSVLTISGTGDLVFEDGKSGPIHPWPSLTSMVKKIVVETGITGIYSMAFSYFKNLAVAELPDGLTTIGPMVFTNCQNLCSVELPGSVVRIEMSAFSGCINLSSIGSLDNVEYFGARAFNECRNLTLPPINFFYITGLGEYAFSGCKGLKSVRLFSHNIGLMDRAFAGTDLEEVLLPDDQPYGIAGLFYQCEHLTSIHIPPVVWSIGSYTFAYSGVTELDIPESVQFIGDNAFAYSNLSSIRISPHFINYSGSEPYFRSGTFQGSKLQTFTVPVGIKIIRTDVFSDCSELKSIQLHDNIEEIGWLAFSNCTSLTTLTIPSGKIGYRFAAGSGLVSVHIMEKVTSISDEAFGDCKKLADIIVNNANPQYSSVNGILFNKDKTTVICYPGGKAESEYTIPSTVKNIKTGAFSDSDNLKHITIPSSVTAVKPNAFKIKGLTIETENQTPQLVELEAFGADTIVPTCTLIVPDGTSALYKNAKVWRDFGSIIEKSEVKNEPVALSGRLVAYPSPADDVLYVECDAVLIGQSVKIFGLNSALIAEYPVTALKTAIDVSTWPAGIYIVRTGSQTAKFIKR